MNVKLAGTLTSMGVIMSAVLIAGVLSNLPA
ncbi:membrane protein [Microbacterium phage Lifes]|nr:membrane protein [Microbacterium phage Lifes]